VQVAHIRFKNEYETNMKLYICLKNVYETNICYLDDCIIYFAQYNIQYNMNLNVSARLLKLL